MTEYFFTDEFGEGHRVTIVERGPKMTCISYFDNRRRGRRHVNGREYNHGTRVRRVIYNHEIREVTT